jgi:hypothetical protein
MENTHKKENWMNGITCNDRFVAFLDIDGFSDFVLKNPIKDCYNLLHTMKSEVIDNLQRLYDAKEENGIGRMQEFGSSKFINFSDSVILFTKGNSIDDLKGLLFDVAAIYTFCFRKLKKPLRGAVAYGEIYLDFENNIYTGKPIIDANKLHENLNYYGVDISKTAKDHIELINRTQNPSETGASIFDLNETKERHICNLIRLDNAFTFFNHDFTKEKNEKESFGINFVALNNPSYLPSVDKSILEELKKAAIENKNNCETEKIKIKFENTIKYVEALNSIAPKGKPLKFYLIK